MGDRRSVVYQFQKLFADELNKPKNKYYVSALGVLYKFIQSNTVDFRILVQKVTEGGKKAISFDEWKAYMKNICLEALNEDPEVNVKSSWYAPTKKVRISEYNVRCALSFIKLENLYNEVRSTKSKSKEERYASFNYH